MATLGASLASEKNSSRLSYITVAAFNAAFFTYTLSTTDFVTTGTLTAVINPATGVAVTSGDCPAGRVLRETGRKLYATAAYPGVSTYMVSVYDSVLGINGFIDPNTTLFAIYNVDKPNFVDADVNEQTNYGPPIYTGGTVTATGNITSTNGNVAATLYDVTAGRDISAGRDITAGRDSTATRNITAGVNFITTTGGLVLTSKNGAASCAGSTTLGAGGASTVTTSAATTSSLIFVTNVGPATDGSGGAATGFLRVTRAAGSFVINSSNGTDRSVVAWFIVN